METLTQCFSLDLAPGSVYQVARARGARVRVKHGQVWLTEEGVLADNILHKDTVHTVQGQGAVVIEALTVTRICVESDAGFSVATQQLAKSVWARVTHALRERVRHIHLGEPHRAH
ncbi:MAG: hypothetical protein RL341_1238 [Pseudomonadota bacterium]|jgi:hypothetical protein